LLLVGLVGCEIGLCAFVLPRVPCVPCVSRLPPVSFYRYLSFIPAWRSPHLRARIAR